ncbi:piggyBac transposable element-derived protein 3-like protein [Leptotrombidium deliense]|uniref:PiggyBac transposable element-derived protein 3-like protein n=1 Tax=Leptotrombidium deliense TaxID=299467 RepID=A0A443S4F6_9ACAR|nr:piggyBac transposable element-derived protein 3-like protein [Leptotrombidium deliense]
MDANYDVSEWEQLSDDEDVELFNFSDDDEDPIHVKKLNKELPLPVYSDESDSSDDIATRSTQKFEKTIECEDSSDWKQQPFITKTIDDCTTFSPSLWSAEDYFDQYIADKTFEQFAEFTNIYYKQRTERDLNATANEIRRLFAINILMGCFNLPRTREYWTKSMRINNVADILPRNRYFLLRNCIHIANNELDKSETDRLWKIRPFLNIIRETMLLKDRSKHLSIDEQMIPFRGRHSIRQYMPQKPIRFGFKNYCLATPEGLILDFEIYQGSTTPVDQNIKAQFNQTTAIVHHLCRTIPRNLSHIIYVDRYFTSLALFEHLLSNGIYATGTARIDRVRGIPFMNSKLLKKEKRGFFEEFVKHDDTLSAVRWIDNKPVVLISSFHGATPTESVSRFFRKEKQRQNIECPAVVSAYNQSMGGVDLNDRFIANYRIGVRSRKWTVRCLFHFLDLVVANAWIEYKIDAASVGETNIMDLYSYRKHIAEHLVSSTEKRKRGRPTKSPVVTPKKMDRRKHAVDDNKRMDTFSHWPVFVQQKSAPRCANGCGKWSRIKCEKCGVFLCIKEDQDCFKKYHTSE